MTYQMEYSNRRNFVQMNVLTKANLKAEMLQNPFSVTSLRTWINGDTVAGDAFHTAVKGVDKLFIVAPASCIKDGTAFAAMRASNDPLAVSCC